MTFARFALAVILIVPCMAVPGRGYAQLPGENPYKGSQSVWLSMDRCKRQAFQKFPDYTAESNAKREKAVQQCLEANNLPPMPPLPSGNGAGSSGR